jgi:hypothetical protein
MLRARTRVRRAAIPENRCQVRKFFSRDAFQGVPLFCGKSGTQWNAFLPDFVVASPRSVHLWFDRSLAA